MLSPKRTKFRKAHKGRIHGNSKGGTSLNFGAYGLKAMAPERITARQIEAARRAITRHFVVLAVYGSAYFLMCLYHQSLPKCGWVRERVRQNFGWHVWPLAGSCLNLTVCHGNLHRKRSNCCGKVAYRYKDRPPPWR